MDRSKQLGEEKITTLLKKFSIPAIIGMLINAFYNIVDRIYIGNSADLGTLGLAGITISFPIVMVMMALSVLIGIGGATLFSIRLGENKSHEAGKILGNAATLIIIVSVIFTLVGLIFLEELLALFGASPEVMSYAGEYMRIVLFGAIFQGISMAGNNFIRADGSPKIAMISMVLGAGFNIIFDPIFIYLFRWGMTGAALATIGGQGLSALWVIYYFMGKRSSHKISFKNMKLDWNLSAQIMATGIPAFLMQIANSLLNIILNKSLAFYGGDVAISAMGIINSVQTLMLLPIIGINQGAQPILGYNYGAQKNHRVKETLKWAILSATIIALVAYLGTRIYSKELITLFNQDEDLISFGSRAMIIWFFFLPVVGFQMVSASYFQAVGKVKPAIFLTMTRQVILLIPALLILPQYYGLEGILYAAPFADITSALITGIGLTLDLKPLGGFQKNET